MWKRVSIITIFSLLALGGVLFFTGVFDEEETSEGVDSSPEESGSEEETAPDLDDIFEKAAQGGMPGLSPVVGETTAQEVQEAWGEPEEVNETKDDRMLNYASRNVEVGVIDEVVSEIRSTQEEITSIHLETLQSYQTAEEVTVEKTETESGLMITYAFSGGFILEWGFGDASGNPDSKNAEYVSVSKDDGIDLSGMSLDEKIGQMIFGGVAGTGMNEETSTIIREYHPGGIILFGNNIESPEQTVTFLNEMKTTNADNPYPLLFGVDEEGGRVTRVPTQMKSLPPSEAIGDVNDPDLAFTAGTILGEQMETLGFNLDFAPVLDVNSNPDNPVIGDRSFGDTVDVVSDMGIQVMKGMQEEGIIPVVKHFPGHGDTSEDSHVTLPTVDKSYEELKELELAPFRNAIEQGAEVTMIAHIFLPQIDATYPSSMSEEVITGMLREDYDFDGVVITDDLTMGAITNQYTVAEAALQTVKAGGDLLLMAHDPDLIPEVVDGLKTAVENGELTEERIDESVERIIELKQNYNLSREPTSSPEVESLNRKVEEVRVKVR